MSEQIATFAKYFGQTVIAIDEVESCVATQLFNTFAAPKAVLPYGIFQVTPLEDKFGQARQSSMTRLLVDLKFVTSVPPPASVAPAVKAVRDHFRSSLSQVFEGYRISVRHDRPIYLPEPGATPDEKLLNFGSTYMAWMTELPA